MALLKNTTKEFFFIAGSKFILPLLVSVLFIWAVGLFFCDSLRPFTYDSALEKYIHTPGTVYKQRSEGFATTRKGLFGINGISDISQIKKRKIVVWGDSYIEAHQVADSEKTPQVVTEILARKKLDEEFICFGVGMSGDSVADYYFEIPRYGNVINGIVAHYIFITGLSDILPDQSTDDKKGLFSANPLRLHEDDWKPKFQNLKSLFATLHISFVWRPLVSFPGVMKQLRFAPGRQVPKLHKKTGKVREQSVSEDSLIPLYHFLLKSLRAQTRHRLTFVYAPMMPKIQNGKIRRNDSNATQMALFRTIAAQYDIEVLDMGDAFLRFYEKTGLFPRGFVNTEPGAGHLNRYGHAVVAATIADHFINRNRRQ